MHRRIFFFSTFFFFRLISAFYFVPLFVVLSIVSVQLSLYNVNDAKTNTLDAAIATTVEAVTRKRRPETESNNAQIHLIRIEMK